MLRSILKFLIILFVSLGLFLLFRPTDQIIYRKFLLEVASLVLNEESRTKKIAVGAASPERAPLDSEIRLSDPQNSGPGQLELAYDSVGYAWVPTILLASLTIASPILIRRRILALLLGETILHLYLIFGLWIYIQAHLPELGTFVYSTPVTVLLSALEDTMIEQLGPSFVVPVLCWVLVSFRAEDLNRLTTRLAKRN